MTEGFLDERRARRAYFMRALDAADTERRCTGAAPPEETTVSAGESETALIARLTGRAADRARRLLGQPLEPYYLPSRHWGWWALPLCVLLGVCANYLGPSEKVDLLANPLVTLILWNLAVFALLAVRALRRGAGPAGLPAWLYRLADRMPHPFATGDEPTALLRKARAAFRARWQADHPGLAVASVATRLHLCAAALTTGALAGLYLRGFARAYSFHWMSTFVAPEARAGVLGWVFAPVTALTGRTIPPLEGANGAAWIHLLALTALLYVVVPRLLLAAWSAHTRRRKARRVRLPVHDAYFRALTAAGTSVERLLTLVGYSYRLTEQRTVLLTEAAQTVWGPRTRLAAAQDVAWGDTTYAGEAATGRRVMLLCFSGAQTPEEEVHSAFARAWMRACGEDAGLQWCVLVDCARLAGEAAIRRRGAWADVLAAGGIHGFCWVDVSLGTEEVARALGAALQEVVR